MGRELRRGRTGAVEAVGAVLFLHGGRERSFEPVRAYRLAVIRVQLLAWFVGRRLARHGVSVWALRFSVRGWNGDGMSPVADARWALAEIDRRAGPLPTVLIGHSMGGRTAMRVADAANVVGVIGLAPWLPSGEPLDALNGRLLRIAHGTADRTTDPTLSRAFADRAIGLATSVAYEVVPGDGHALLRHPRAWNRICAEGALEMLGTLR